MLNSSDCLHVYYLWWVAQFGVICHFSKVTFSKVVLKVTRLHGYFSRFFYFLSCTNGNKSRNASHLQIFF